MEFSPFREWFPLSVSIFIVSLAMAAPAHAIDSCSSNADYTVRLDKKGSSLETSKILDQDGLGVCYAATSATVLKSALPGNPDISYLEYASDYKKSDAKKLNISSPKITKSVYETTNSQLKLLVDGGFLCENFEDIKKNGLCPKDKVALEDPSKTSPSLQKQAFTVLGSFHDQLQDFNPTERKKIKKALAATYDNLKKEAERSCSHPDDLPKSFSKAMETIYTGLKQKIVLLPENDPNRSRLEKSLALLGKEVTLPAEKGAPKDATQFVPSTKLQNLMKIDYREKLAEMRKIDIESGNYSEVTEAILEKAGLSRADQSDLLPSISSYTNSEWMGTDYNTTKEECIKDHFYQWTHTEKVKSEAIFQSHLSGCTSGALNAKVTETLFFLLNEIKADDRSKNLIDDLDGDTFKYIAAIIGSTCKAKDRIHIPANMKCNSLYVDQILYPTAGSGKLMDNNEELNAVTQKMHEKIFSQLSSGKATFVAVCAQIFNHPEIDTFFSKNSQCQNEKGDFMGHAVSVVGFRCEGGHASYLIQNSWGEFVGSGTADNGRTWMPETNLMKNIYGIETLESENEK